MPFATSFIGDHPGSRISATLFAIIIFMVDLFQFILFRSVIGEQPKKENLNAHDWEEYRAVSLMVLVAVVYILVGLLLPKWILVVIALGLGARTLNNTIGRRLQRQSKAK
ncbi:Transmembrane protein 175 [Lacticaseibacillus paracasei subsp. paracasei Lpp70]|nr:Transmembrane protein 175 [Lacticaseibacillus paracasei subsp. paracasei Lpp70]